jgi:hypothetical protein
MVCPRVCPAPTLRKKGQDGIDAGHVPLCPLNRRAAIAGSSVLAAGPRPPQRSRDPRILARQTGRGARQARHGDYCDIARASRTPSSSRCGSSGRFDDAPNISNRCGSESFAVSCLNFAAYCSALAASPLSAKVAASRAWATALRGLSARARAYHSSAAPSCPLSSSAVPATGSRSGNGIFRADSHRVMDLLQRFLHAAGPGQHASHVNSRARNSD